MPTGQCLPSPIRGDLNVKSGDQTLSSLPPSGLHSRSEKMASFWVPEQAGVSHTLLAQMGRVGRKRTALGEGVLVLKVQQRSSWVRTNKSHNSGAQRISFTKL